MTTTTTVRQKMNPSIGAMLVPARDLLTQTHGLLSALNLAPLKLGYGETRFSFEIPEKFGDREGWAPAGFLSIVLDSMMGVALFSTLEEFKPVVTINLRTDYMRPLKCGARAMCSCTLLSNVDDVIFVEGRIVAEENDELIGAGSGSFLVVTPDLSKMSKS